MTACGALRVATYNVHACVGRDGRHDPDRGREERRLGRDRRPGAKAWNVGSVAVAPEAGDGWRQKGNRMSITCWP